jgi:anti-anti-sigma factor
MQRLDVRELIMKTKLDEAHGILTICLAGELDAMSVPTLRPALDHVLEIPHARLVVDITGLKLLDSCGVGLLVYLFRRLHGSGRAFGLRGASEQPLSILRLMKLDQIFLDDGGPEQRRSAQA